MSMLGDYELNRIYTGDARELCKGIPDKSVDLIFTDPVYDRIEDYEWLAEMASRVLKPDSACLVYYATKHLPEVIEALNRELIFCWQFANYMPTLNAIGFRKTFNNWRGLLWFGKGKTSPNRYIRDLLIDGFKTKNNGHKWAKNTYVLSYYLTAFLNNGVVLEPFCGGGSLPSASVESSLDYLAFEIDPDTADKARERVRMTQPPLVFPQYEQQTLEIE